MKNLTSLAFVCLVGLVGCAVDPAMVDDVPLHRQDVLVDAGAVPLGLMPQAVAYVNLDGTVFQSVEAWNPEGAAPLKLGVVKQDTGVYDVVAPSGVFLLGGHVTAQYTPAVSGIVESVTDDTTARVHLTDGTNEGADIDSAFLVSLW